MSVPTILNSFYQRFIKVVPTVFEYDNNDFEVPSPMICTNDFVIHLPTIFPFPTNDFVVGRTPLKSLVRGVLAKNHWQEETSCQRFLVSSNDLSLLAMIFPRCDDLL